MKQLIFLPTPSFVFANLIEKVQSNPCSLSQHDISHDRGNTGNGSSTQYKDKRYAREYFWLGPGVIPFPKHT